MQEILFNNEIAKPLKYCGYYATKSGKVISVKVRGKRGELDYSKPFELKYKTDKDGYLEVCLSYMLDNKQKRVYYRVHRLIWEAYNGEICDNLTIDHINNEPSDNRLENLQLLTREKNTSKARKGKETWQKGKKHSSRVIYKCYKNNKYIGNYDRKELIEKFDLSKYDVENPFKLTKRKLENNIRLEKV